MHIDDVRRGMEFMTSRLLKSVEVHDHDKISGITDFHANFATGFAQRNWLDNHYKVNRHHLKESAGVPEDVNLLDVLEMVVDCVMAGMSRSGDIFPIVIPPEVLQKAIDNTVSLLKSEVEVDDKNDGKMVPKGKWGT
jgi:hypothetical protein